MKSSSETQKAALATAGRLSSDGIGFRYALALAVESDLKPEETSRILMESLARLIPRVHSLAPDQLLPTLTDAVGVALFGNGWRTSSKSDPDALEAQAIREFCSRVCRHADPSLENCLNKEFSWFFLGEGGPRGPEAASQAMDRTA